MADTAFDTRPTLLARLLAPHPDPGSWSEFVRCYGGQIHSWCRAWGLQHTDAEDVTQTVLVRLLRKMQKFQYDPEQSFRGWLRTVSYRVFLDWRTDSADEPAGTGDTGVYRLIASAAARDDFAHRIEAEYAREVLHAAMLRVRGRVRPPTWACFYQTAVEGRAAPNVAKDLGVSVAQLFVYRNRVRNMLAEEITLLNRAPASPIPSEP